MITVKRSLEVTTCINQVVVSTEVKMVELSVTVDSVQFTPTGLCEAHFVYRYEGTLLETGSTSFEYSGSGNVIEQAYGALLAQFAETGTVYQS